MDIWHLADPGRRAAYGWLGRYADRAFPNHRDPLLTLAIGGGDKAPRAIQGKEHPGLSLARPENYRFLADQSNPKLAELYRKLNQGVAEAGAAPEPAIRGPHGDRRQHQQPGDSESGGPAQEQCDLCRHPAGRAWVHEGERPVAVAGTQGWEFMQIGIAYQYLLYAAFVVWLVIVPGGVWPAMRAARVVYLSAVLFLAPPGRRATPPARRPFSFSRRSVTSG